MNEVLLLEILRVKEAEQNARLARILAVHRLREQGFTLREIGAALGVSHEWVRQVLLTVG